MTDNRETGSTYEATSYNTPIFPAESVLNAKNLGGKKETIGHEIYISPSASQEWLRVPVEARFYMGRSSNASTVYCSVWIRHSDGREFTGHGKAGGYGYHKASAALEDALHNAGIGGQPIFGGCGETAMQNALAGIARACGYNDCIHISR